LIDETYHIFTRSIADFKVFNKSSDYVQLQRLMKYYQFQNDLRFSDFVELELVGAEGFNKAIEIVSKDKERLVQIIAYCLMQTHIHLILKQLSENGISRFMKDLLISYTRTFNLIHKRKGPLWESRFQSVLVDSDEQLLHLTRYVHLNPVTARLIDNPEDWKFSSYNEYIGNDNNNANNNNAKICQFDDLLDVKPTSYRKFVNDRISYQRELAKIKSTMID